MELFETIDEIKISGLDFGKLLRDILIQRKIIAPLGHPIRDTYNWSYRIDKLEAREHYELVVYRYEIEKDPEPEKPYQAGDWIEEESD